MPFFSKVFKSKDDGGKAKKSKSKAKENGAVQLPPPKPKWTDAWTRTVVDAEEVQELLSICTVEMKARGSYTAPVAA